MNQPPAVDGFSGSRDAPSTPEGSDSHYPSWVSRLPAPIRALVIFFIYSLMLPDDSFRDRLRKLVMGTTCSVGIFSLAVIVLDFTTGAVAYRPGTVVSEAALIAQTIIFIAVFVFLKCWPRRAHVTTQLYLYALLVTLFVQSISFIHSSRHVIFCVFTIGVIITRPRPMWPLITLAIGGYVLAAYNTVALRMCVDHDHKLAAMSNPDIRLDQTTAIVELVTTKILFCLIYFALELSLQEAERLHRCQVVTIGLASELAAALAIYDTSAAERLIQDTRSTKLAEAELLSSFHVIVDNLNRYRPHIPNWVLRDEDACDDELEMRPDGSPLRDMDRSSTQGTTSRSRSGSYVGSLRLDAHTKRRKSAGAAFLASGPPFSSLLLAKPCVHNVVIAQIGFGLRSNDGDDSGRLLEIHHQRESDHTIDLVAAYTGIVDRIHAVASETSAAVHSFFGDVALITWNAVSTVQQPEAKAVRFMARVKRDAGHAAMRVHGCAAAGEARVFLAGSGGLRRGKQALCLRCDFTETAMQLMQFATEHGAMIVDRQVQQGGRHTVDCRGVALRSWLSSGPVNTATAPRVKNHANAAADAVYEIVAESHTCTEEWLYMNDKHAALAAANSNEKLCQIVDALANSRTFEAAAIADTLPSSVASEPIVSWMLARIKVLRSPTVPSSSSNVAVVDPRLAPRTPTANNSSSLRFFHDANEANDRHT
jgi:hypothetical protein